MIVLTSRVSFAGPDRLDVTRKSGEAWAKAFAPSWKILGPVVAGRRRANGLRAVGKPVLADEVEADVWSSYVRAFFDEMRTSYATRRADWERLLAMPRAVLCCYCVDADHCHRTLLGRDILPRLGASYGGEIT